MGAADTELVYLPDHGERAFRALLTQDLDKPRIAALARAMGAGAQELEDTTFDLIIGRALSAAVGAQLDQWGSVVGEARVGLDDEDYRRFIRARVLANICRGTVDEIIAIWSLVTAPATTVRYLPMHPAGFKLYVVRKKWLAEALRRRIRRMLEAVKPAGVTIELIEALDGFFGFDENPDAAGYDVGKLARIL